MSTPWYIFPPDSDHDASVARHDTAGWTITARSATHPSNGAKCQQFDIPDGTPDVNGCALTITDIHGKPYYKDLHGILYLHLAGVVGAGLLVDVYPLRQVPVPAPALAPLTSSGRFIMAGDQKLRWRSPTGFRLVEFVAHGRASEAVDFLGWCGEQKVAPRVLAMAKHLFELTPNEGRDAMPRLLELAKQAGCYLEITVLADTKSYTLDFAEQVRFHGEAARASGLAAVEVANEVLDVHPTQDNSLGDTNLLRQLAELVPMPVPVSLGSNHADQDENRAIAIAGESLPNGYVTDHMSRTDEENGWKWVRHTNELGWIADDTKQYAINDEPKRSDLTPGKHLALAVLCHAIRDIGDTFHYAGGLQGQIPTGAELAAFNARKQGWDLVAAETWLHHGTYRNAGQGWPVKGFSNALRVYSVVEGDKAITLALDAQNVHIDWDEHANPTELVSMDGARVYRVTQ